MHSHLILGTWVPFERGVALAQQYHVQHLLQPIFDFVQTEKSPPLAPKHITAASLRPRKPREPRAPGQPKPRKRKLKDKVDIANAEESQISYSELESDSGTGSGLETDEVEVGDEDSDVSMIEDVAGRSELSSVSQTPSPVDSDDISSERSEGSDLENRHRREPGSLLAPPSSHKRRKHHHRRHRRRERERGKAAGEEEEDYGEGVMDTGPYARTLLDYFVRADIQQQQIHQLIMHPPQDLDINLMIDLEGHTCLHWASAMGRMKMVRILIGHGADIYRVNHTGQTALMRSVLFTNNHDNKTFPQLLEVLQKTIFNIDVNDQTVFHHVAITASSKGKVHASRYYLECLVDKLRQVPAELASILNVQDVAGDTALVIAARIANKKLVKLLLESGADPNIRNKSGKTAQDYIVEADRLARLRERSDGSTLSAPGSPSLSSVAVASSMKVAPTVNQMFKELSTLYNGDLRQWDQDLRDAQSVHAGILSELQETKAAITESQQRAEGLPAARERVREMEDRLRVMVNRRQLRRLRELVEEEQRKLGLEDEEDGTAAATGMTQRTGPVEVSTFSQEGPAHISTTSSTPSSASAGEVRGARSEPINPPTPPLYIKEERQEHPNPVASSSSAATSTFPQSGASSPSLQSQSQPQPPPMSQLAPPPTIEISQPSSSSSSSSPLTTTNIATLEQQAARLRDQLAQMQASRRALVEDVVRLSGQAGHRHADYKQLIALCCGVPIEGVDTLLGPLLEALAAEETYT